MTTNAMRKAAGVTVLAGAAALAGLTASGINSAAADTSAPKAVACTFQDGTSRTLVQGQYKSEAAGLVTFDLEAIDLDKLSAILRTTRGDRPVRLVRAINAFHVLEVLTEGFLNVTTIYDKDDALGALPAVHSRHFGILGQPVVSQYYGVCRIK